MKFGCHIWVLKVEVECANEEGMLDLLENSVNKIKTSIRRTTFFIAPSWGNQDQLRKKMSKTFFTARECGKVNLFHITR